MSVSYISFHLSEKLKEKINVSAFADWHGKHENAISTFTDLYDVEHESNGSDASSHSTDDETSHSIEDMIASLHLLNRLQITLQNKRIADLLKTSHEEPHIEFLSPPPELFQS